MGGRHGRSFHVGPGLAFRLEDPPPALAESADEYLAYFGEREADAGVAPLRITAQAPPRPAAGPPLVTEPPLEVRRSGEITFFEVPGVLAWCDGRRATGGVFVEDASAARFDLFVHLAFAALLFELAAARGWWGMHAAAVAVDGRGVLLPGASGAGKSTVFRHAHRHGLGVLSDDLVWLRQAGDGVRLHAFPRGRPWDPTPGPTTDDVALGAIVCPTIVDRPRSELVPLALPEVLEVLAAQSGTLAAARGDHFRMLVRAASVPGYRLEAGSDCARVPALLEAILG